MKCPHCGHRFLPLSERARSTLRYMIRECPNRGGFMFEGARPDFEAGIYRDAEIEELLRVGAIKPHEDPAKGWVVADSRFAE